MKSRHVLLVLLLLLVGFLAWWLRSPGDRTIGASRKVSETVRPPEPVPAAVPAERPGSASTSDPAAATSPTAASEVAFLVGRVTCKETGQPVVACIYVLPVDDDQPIPGNFGYKKKDPDCDADGRFRVRVPLEGNGLKPYRLLVVDNVRPRRYLDYTSWNEALKPLLVRDCGVTRTTEIPAARQSGVLARIQASKKDMATLTFPPLRPGEERRHDIGMSMGLNIVVEAVWAGTGQPVRSGGGMIRIPDVSSGTILIRDGRSESRYDVPYAVLENGTIEASSGHSGSGVLPLKNFPTINGCKIVRIVLDKGRSLKVLVLGPDGRPYTKECSVFYWASRLSFTEAGMKGMEMPENPRDSNRSVVSPPISPSLCTLRPVGDGTFEEESLPKEDGFSLLALGKDAFMTEPVKVLPDQTVTLLLKAGGRVSGRIRDANGVPVAGANVLAWFPDLVNLDLGETKSTYSVCTDSEGRYEFPCLPDRPGLCISAFFPARNADIEWSLQDGSPLPKQRGCSPAGWRNVPVGQVNVDIGLTDEMRSYR